MALLSSDPSDGCRMCGGRGYIPHRGEPVAADPCSCMTDGEEDERSYRELIEDGFAIWDGDRDEAQKAAIRIALAGEDMLAALKRILNHPLIRLTGDVEPLIVKAVAKAEGR